jgi:tRNA(Ile)-lysidine synthase
LALGQGALIATGHTADDQVETILYRLASSPGRRALLGMRQRDGSLVRPLLGFTRAQTTAYCVERGLAWRDDPTNAEGGYARNRVRHGLAAALAEVHPAAARNVLRTADLLRDEAEVLDSLVNAELGANGSERGTIELSRLAELPPAAPPGGRCPARRITPSRSRACAARAPRCSISAAACAPWSSAASCTPSAEPPKAPALSRLRPDERALDRRDPRLQ